jgi:hypothetical protein
MVFVLPNEFRSKDEEEISMAQLALGPQPLVFEKPKKKAYRHLKPLYIKGYINGKPMNKMLVDGGAVVNLMPYSTCRQLGKTTEDLIKTNVTLNAFNGDPIEAKGVLNVELTVGCKTIPTTFFVVDSRGTYSVLLGRDWIHANCCIPSTMHQCLIQWDEDEVEVVQADDSTSVALADADFWNSEGQECLSGHPLEDCEYLQVSKQGL